MEKKRMLFICCGKEVYVECDSDEVFDSIVEYFNYLNNTHSLLLDEMRKPWYKKLLS